MRTPCLSQLGAARLQTAHCVCLRLLAWFCCLALASCHAHKTELQPEAKIKTLASWQGYLGRHDSLENRIYEAPPLLIEYLQFDNMRNNYVEVPKPTKCDTEFLADMKQALTELPDPVKRQIEKHLIGIFPVAQLGSTGYSEIIGSNDTLSAIIVVDINALSRKAGDWFVWRENSCFKPDGKIAFQAVLEEPANDNRKQSMQYILLHEFGHVIGLANGFHPDWHARTTSPQVFAFSKISWETQQPDYQSKYDKHFTLRTGIRYYAFEKAILTAAQMRQSYQQLQQTDFCSLYGAKDPFEDFAETYAMYVHVVLQKKPWEVNVLESGAKQVTLNTPILDSRLKVKKQFLDDFFSHHL